MWALVAMAPALVVPIAGACRGGTGARFVALQLASALTGPLLVAMTFAFDQSSLIDLALTLCLLSLPATLLMASFLDRWL